MVISEFIEVFDYLECQTLLFREKYKNDYLTKPEMTLADYCGLLEELPITFDSYQAGTQYSANFPSTMPASVYCALGFAGETGEFCEVVKKLYRNRDGVVTDDVREKLIKEAGDALYYLAACLKTFDITLSEVANVNQIKLVDRLKRNVIKSEGDNR